MAHTDIISKLPSCFDNALKSGDLLFFPSTSARYTDSDIEVGDCHGPPLQVIAFMLHLRYSMRYASVQLCNTSLLTLDLMLTRKHNLLASTVKILPMTTDKRVPTLSLLPIIIIYISATSRMRNPKKSSRS